MAEKVLTVTKEQVTRLAAQHKALAESMESAGLNLIFGCILDSQSIQGAKLLSFDVAKSEIVVEVADAPNEVKGEVSA